MDVRASGDARAPRSLGRADRLTRVIEKLQVQASTARELLDRLELAPGQLRSLQRDLNLLVDRGDVRRLPDGLRYAAPSRPAVRLNEVEAVAVYSAARLLYHHAAEYNAHYRSALEKLAALLPGPARALAQATNSRYASRPNARQARTSELVAQAWLQGHWLTFEYAAPSTGRAARRVELATYFLEINPQNRAAYAIGLDRTGKRPDVRVFKVSRMRQPALLAETYEVPPDFDPLAYISSAWGIMSGPPTEVVLRFASSVADRVLEEHWPQTRSCERLDDGRVELVLGVGGTLELLPWIRGWGATVEVVSPPDLRDRVAEEARATAAVYSLPGLRTTEPT